MLPLLGHAQTVAYNYDAAGNRTARHRLMNTRRMKASDDARLFTATPNPVSDILQVKYEDEPNFTGEYNYSLQGVYGETALSGSSASATCGIDVSGLTKGVYILRIVYREEEQSIKIIRK